MSVSIYYSAKRGEPLSPAEEKSIAVLDTEFDLSRSAPWGAKMPWEGFCIYPRSADTGADVVFEGATKLPDDSEEAMWHAVQHWTALLSAIRRRVLPTAIWHVHIDDHDLTWDETAAIFDPSK